MSGGVASGEHVLLVAVLFVVASLSQSKPVIVQPALSLLRVGCAADTPILLHNCLLVWPSTNKPVDNIQCRLSGQNEEKVLNCSRTAVLFTGLVPGVHRLVLTATLALEKASYTYRLIVPVNSSTCTVHLINQGVTVNCSSATAEFAGYGAYTHFSCKLDGPPAFPCTSPLHLTSLTPGEHWLRVIAEGCKETIRQTFFFTVPPSSVIQLGTNFTVM